MEQGMRTELDISFVSNGIESPELVDAIIDAVNKLSPDPDFASTNMYRIAEAIEWAASHV
jgi:hypothetical protein